jgi:dCTP deaminase
MSFLTIREIANRVKELFPENEDDVLEDIYGPRPWTMTGVGNDFKIQAKHQYKASYDLHLGDEVAKSTNSKPFSLARNNGIIEINPGEFALLHTYEKIRVPNNLIGFISLRFSVKKKGLINISGFHVDPGFEDYLVFSVYNAGSRPICLRYKEPIFMISYATLSGETEKYTGRTPGNHFISDDIESLKGPALTVIDLDRRLERAENQLRLLIGLFIATLSATIVALVTLFR